MLNRAISSPHPPSALSRRQNRDQKSYGQFAQAFYVAIRNRCTSYRHVQVVLTVWIALPTERMQAISAGIAKKSVLVQHSCILSRPGDAYQYPPRRQLYNRQGSPLREPRRSLKFPRLESFSHALSGATYQHSRTLLPPKLLWQFH